ncbi:hypothetical protein HDU76_010977, partial [Blyttiomyces sp. JEL0837]
TENMLMNESGGAGSDEWESDGEGSDDRAVGVIESTVESEADGVEREDDWERNDERINNIEGTMESESGGVEMKDEWGERNNEIIDNRAAGVMECTLKSGSGVVEMEEECNWKDFQLCQLIIFALWFGHVDLVQRLVLDYEAEFMTSNRR